MECTPCDAPFDKNGVYFFTVPKFHRTGTFRLIFHVMPSPVYYYVDPAVAVGDEAGKGIPPPPPPQPKPFNVRPLEFIVQV